ncbi:hypothetical protein JNB11_05620 [Kocuria palustris]|nr:hypothetical protein [Kocuria palustris]
MDASCALGQLFANLVIIAVERNQDLLVVYDFVREVLDSLRDFKRRVALILNHGGMVPPQVSEQQEVLATDRDQGSSRHRRSQSPAESDADVASSALPLTPANNNA